MCVPVCPQSWTLPHQLSSPLLCLLTLSLPPLSPPASPPPCVEMVHIMCLQTHAYRQWPPHTDTQHNIRNPHICMALHTFTQHTITHAHSNNLMQCTQHATIHARVISGLWLLRSLNFEANHLLIKWLVIATQPLETAVLNAQCMMFFFLAV